MKIFSIDEFEDLFESESLIFKNICDNNNIKFSSDICKYKIPRARTYPLVPSIFLGNLELQVMVRPDKSIHYITLYSNNIPVLMSLERDYDEFKKLINTWNTHYGLYKKKYDNLNKLIDII